MFQCPEDSERYETESIHLVNSQRMKVIASLFSDSTKLANDRYVITLEPSRKPLNLLVKKLNGEVSIRLKNDVEYRGRMIDADSHMNIILEKATEYRANSPTANYGNVILRGSNILYICVESKQS